METFEELITEWMEHMTIQKGRRPRSVMIYERIVRSFWAWYLSEKPKASLKDVTRPEIEEWMKYLFYERNNLSNRSRATKLSALRSFFSWLRYAKHIHSDPTRGVPSPKIRPKMPQKFSTEELRLLFAAPRRDTVRGLRDLAILKTMYASGLRVGEIVRLDCAHLVDTGGYIRLQVMDGKGGKGRMLTLRSNPSKTLRQWLLVRRDLDAEDDGLFVRLTGRPGRVSEQTIQRVIKKYAAVVGIESADAFCHKMRSTFATDLYDSGNDKCPRCGQGIQYVGILELAALMGHDDIKTTMGYVAISERTLRKTAIPDKRFNEIERED